MYAINQSLENVSVIYEKIGPAGQHNSVFVTAYVTAQTPEFHCVRQPDGTLSSASIPPIITLSLPN
jgi:hypothetical protein